jgi:colicin import membrane protein
MLKEILKHPGALFIAIALHLLVIMVFVVSFSWTKPPTILEKGIPIQLIQETPSLTNTQPEQSNQLSIQSKDTKKKETIISSPLQNTASILATQKAIKFLTEKKAKEQAEEKAKLKAAKEVAEKKAKEQAEEKAKLKAAEAKVKKETREQEIRAASLKKWKEKKRLEKEQKLAAKKKAKEEAEKKKQAAVLAKEKVQQEKVAAVKAKVIATKKAQRKAKSNWGKSIVNHVKRRWQIPPGTSGMSAKVRVKISPSGYIRGEIEMIHCDGHPSYCTSIIQAYKNAEPLPRPSRNDLDRTFLITMDDK